MAEAAQSSAEAGRDLPGILLSLLSTAIFHVAEGERSQKRYPNKSSMCTALHRLYIAWLYIGWHIKILVPGVGYFLSCWSGLSQVPPKQIQAMVVVLGCPQELDGKAPIAG